MSSSVVPTSTAPGRARHPSEYADLMPDLHEMAALRPGDPRRARLRRDLIVAFLPVVDNLARGRSGGNRERIEELTQVGTIALINAIDRWDPDRAAGEFLGYLIPCVRGEMLRWFRDRTWSVRVPRRLKETAGAITRISDQLAQELGRAPRPSELAARLGTDVQTIIDALAAQENRRAQSLDATVLDGGATPAERHGAPDHGFAGIENHDALTRLYATLPERERTILTLRFDQEMSQSQIAQRLGLSQMHISRLLSRVLAQLRRGLLDDR